MRSLVLAFGNVNPIPDGSRALHLRSSRSPRRRPAPCRSPARCPAPAIRTVARCATTCDGRRDHRRRRWADAHADRGTGRRHEDPYRLGRRRAGRHGRRSRSRSIPTKQIAGTQNDITFSGGVGAAIVIPRKGRRWRPDCTVNPAINKPQSTFAFQPQRLRGRVVHGRSEPLVLAFGNVDPIPTGSVLYTCNVADPRRRRGWRVSADLLDAGRQRSGRRCHRNRVHDGTVTVGPVVVATTPPVSRRLRVAVADPDELHRVTGPRPSRRPGDAGGRRGRRPAHRRRGFGATPVTVCDDSCAIASPAEHQNGWLLLLPAAMLIWLRRRSR